MHYQMGIRTSETYGYCNLIKNKKLSLETARLLLVPFFREMADRFNIWELSIPGQLFGKAESVLNETEYSHELLMFLDELLIYNNRLWFWMDYEIPWFELDRKL